MRRTPVASTLRRVVPVVVAASLVAAACGSDDDAEPDADTPATDGTSPDGTAAEPPDAARIISTEAQRLGRLVGDLLDLGRLDAHEFSLHPQTVSLAEVVTHTTDSFGATAEDAGVRLTVTSGGGDARVIIDTGSGGVTIAAR